MRDTNKQKTKTKRITSRPKSERLAALLQ